MKTINICGNEIKYNSCSCVNARITSKRFNNLLMQNIGSKENNNLISLTGIEVLKLVNEAIETRIEIEKDKVYYFIETEHYKVVLVLENKQEAPK